MDLGIAGRTAIVCASSRGLGRACATELARAGCRVVVNGRDAAVLERTAAEMRDGTTNFPRPGPFETDRLRSNVEAAARGGGVPAEQVAEERRKGNPAGRFGDPAEFGAACAFLCSAQAGYITGQSLLIDGGAYPGVL